MYVYVAKIPSLVGDVNQHLLFLPTSQQTQEQFQVHSWGTKEFVELTYRA